MLWFSCSQTNKSHKQCENLSKLQLHVRNSYEHRLRIEILAHFKILIVAVRENERQRHLTNWSNSSIFTSVKTVRKEFSVYDPDSGLFGRCGAGRPWTSTLIGADPGGDQLTPHFSLWGSANGT